jgi:type II secretory pathway component PulK
MADPNSFKFDVRVRERMLARGIVSEQDVKSHLETLVDAEQNSESVQQGQPALGAASAAALSGASPHPTSHVGATAPATDEDLEAS